MDELKQLNKLVTELNTTNSTLDKTGILAKYPECKEILSWTYDPFKQYYVSSDNILKMESQIKLSGKHFTSIFDLLDSLDARKYTGHDAIGHILQFISDNKNYRDLILRILDRNLKTRADAKLINKVWPGTVPSFEVALAHKYNDFKQKVDFAKDTWFASRKLDGCLGGETIVEFEGSLKLKLAEVVDKKIDKRIKCYNERTHKVEYKRILSWSKNVDDVNEDHYQWYEIELENGITIKLTGNHRVYLPELKCYRRVDELDGTEKLLFS